MSSILLRTCSRTSQRQGAVMAWIGVYVLLLRIIWKCATGPFFKNTRKYVESENLRRIILSLVEIERKATRILWWTHLVVPLILGEMRQLKICMLLKKHLRQNAQLTNDKMQSLI